MGSDSYIKSSQVAGGLCGIKFTGQLGNNDSDREVGDGKAEYF